MFGTFFLFFQTITFTVCHMVHAHIVTYFCVIRSQARAMPLLYSVQCTYSVVHTYLLTFTWITCVKGSVSQDFWPPFFLWFQFQPIWAPDKQAKVFSNSVSISLRYLITKFEKFDSVVCSTQQSQNFCLSKFWTAPLPEVSDSASSLWDSPQRATWEFEKFWFLKN